MNSGWKWAVVILAMWLVATVVQVEISRQKIYELRHEVSALRELQQERLDAFSEDVYNMSGVMELLEEQALILQVIERRTR